MVFEQLFDETSSTLTYIIGDAVSGEAAIFDPVEEKLERDMAALQRLGLKLKYTVETHAHADHITSAGVLRQRTGAKAAAPFNCGVTPADIHLEESSTLKLGAEIIRVLETPGHTAGSVCYLWRDLVLTGDTIDAEEAARIGLVSGVVPDDALMDEARKLAERVAVNPPRTVRLAKRLLREAQHGRLSDVLELSAAFQALAHETRDHKEAVDAFTEKRTPKFTGE